MTYLDEVHGRTVMSLADRDHAVGPVEREHTPTGATWQTLRARLARMVRRPTDRHRHIGVCRCDVCALRQVGARFG
jgi:hypothetical protein